MKIFSINNIKKFLLKILTVFFWILVWYVIYMLTDNELLIASPVHTVLNLISLSGEKEFWYSAGYSLIRISAGYLCGICAGVVLAVITCKSKLFSVLLNPLFTVVKTTPVASFILVALVWIKRGGVPTFISFLIVLPVIWANTSEGIKNVDVNLLEMADVFRLPKKNIITDIYLPALKPAFLSGCITSVGLAWKAGISAEVLSQPVFAIGSQLYNSKIFLNTDDLFSWTAVVIILSILLEKVVKSILRRLY